MTTILIYLFMLLATPTERTICALWVSQPPTSADVSAACPTDQLDGYIVRAVSIVDGSTWCEQPAPYIYSLPQRCNMMGHTLDNYRLLIIEPPDPAVDKLICTIPEETSAQPDDAEITAACGADAAARLRSGEYRIRMVRQERKSAPVACTPPAPAPGPGMLDQPESIGDLATADDLYLLAGNLIWHGYVHPVCDGLSGYDMRTGAATNCGMSAARAAMITWQNRYDAEIYAAAIRYNIPARVLKELIKRETQFWPTPGRDGEIGLVQMTDGALDLVMLYTHPGYSQQTAARRADIRAQARQTLTCDICSPWQAAEHIRGDFGLYAQALAAYYCASGRDWAAALKLWNVKHNWVDKLSIRPIINPSHSGTRFLFNNRISIRLQSTVNQIPLVTVRGTS